MPKERPTNRTHQDPPAWGGKMHAQSGGAGDPPSSEYEGGRSSGGTSQEEGEGSARGGADGGSKETYPTHYRDDPPPIEGERGPGEGDSYPGDDPYKGHRH